MTRPSNDSLEVDLHRDPIDFRKGINGLEVLVEQALEQDRFHWPRMRQEPVIMLSTQQRNWLLDGYDIIQLKPHAKRTFSTVS